MTDFDSLNPGERDAVWRALVEKGQREDRALAAHGIIAMCTDHEDGEFKVSSLIVEGDTAGFRLSSALLHGDITHFDFYRATRYMVDGRFEQQYPEFL